MLSADLPWWLIFALGVVTGALAVLAIGPTSDAFWEAVYTVRRWCTIIGACVLTAVFLGGVGYLLVQVAQRQP
jgi:hypothetical protein